MLQNHLALCLHLVRRWFPTWRRRLRCRHGTVVGLHSRCPADPDTTLQTFAPRSTQQTRTIHTTGPAIVSKLRIKMVPVGTRLMLLFCVLYELWDSNYRLTYCKLGQFFFWCCSLLFLSGRNLFVLLRMVFNTVLLVCYCYSVLFYLFKQFTVACNFTYNTVSKQCWCNNR